jgi:hypothetical protein
VIFFFPSSHHQHQNRLVCRSSSSGLLFVFVVRALVFYPTIVPTEPHLPTEPNLLMELNLPAVPLQEPNLPTEPQEPNICRRSRRRSRIFPNGANPNQICLSGKFLANSDSHIPIERQLNTTFGRLLGDMIARKQKGRGQKERFKQVAGKRLLCALFVRQLGKQTLVIQIDY